jgi:hypothetical protein
MPHYISKLEGYKTLPDGRKEAITKSYLCDEDGRILHDKAQEDDPDGVKRRVEVEAMKNCIRNAMEFYAKDQDGEIIYRNEKPVYAERIYEEFKGTIKQAQDEMKEEIELKKTLEDEYKKRLKEKTTMKK